MEEGGEGDYIPIATLSPPECTSVNWCFTPSQPVRLYQGDTTKMISALRWAAMRIVNVSLIVRDKVTKQCPQTTTFLKRKESRTGIEPRSFCLPAQTPYRWAKPAHMRM